MRISKYICLIIFASVFAKEEEFEGYINKSERYGYAPNSIYAIGQYEEDLMNGIWEFYTDSTKKVKIAMGEFINGNGTKISNTGIPINGRHGEWKHYYTHKKYRNSNTLSNTIKSIQNWKSGKMKVLGMKFSIAENVPTSNDIIFKLPRPPNCNKIKNPTNIV